VDDVTARRLGERIVLLREGRGMSMTELADAADLAKSYLFKIERGEVLNPGIQTLT
jgi:XRE family transcriptional regulator of biofilm formation